MNTGGPAVRPAFGTQNQNTTNAIQLNETHIFNPTTVNEASFAYLWNNGQVNLGGDYTVPVINVSSLGTGFGDGFALGDFKQHNYHWRDVLTKVTGNHTLKFGYEGTQNDDLTNFATVYEQPSFFFNSILDLIQDKPFSEGGLGYNPLTGQPFAANTDYSIINGGVFAQDSWKVKPNLTLNFGLRWDDYGNPYPSLKGTIATQWYFGPGSTFQQRVANGQLRVAGHLYNHMPNAWSPRGGFAWDPFKTGNWVIRGGFGMYHDMLTLGNADDGVKQNPPNYIVPNFYSNGSTAPPIFAFGTSKSKPQGFPAPSIPSTTLTPAGGLLGSNVGIQMNDPGTVPPTTLNWSLTAERKLFGTVVGSVGYSGSHTYNELWQWGQTTSEHFGYDINTYPGSLLQTNTTVPVRLNPSFGPIVYATNGVRANYNAAIFDVRGRFKRSSFDASYTFSKASDDAQAYPTYVNFEQYYGPSAWDVRNRFSLTWNYELPVVHTSGLAGRVLNGWSVSGTTILQTGTPFTVFTNAPFNPIIQNGVIVGLNPGSGDYQADGATTANVGDISFPNVSSYSIPTGRSASLSGVFAPGQITQPTTLGKQGNEIYNKFRNPGFAETDAALYKNTQLFERLSLQLRFDVFNLFNHPNLGSIDSNLVDGNFGRVTSQYVPRWAQVAAKITF